MPRKGKFFAAGLLLVTLILSSCAAPSQVSATQTDALQQDLNPISIPLPVRTERNIEYVPGGGAYQTLDVYLPDEGDGPFITILAIHGGAFRTRSKAIYQTLGNHFAGQGYAFVAANFTLTQKASYPAQVEDVFCALAWIHANHEAYGFDPEHVFVWGGSSGAYLAGMLGTVETPEQYLSNCPHALPQSDWLAGMILFYGFYDFTTQESIDGFPMQNENLVPYWGATYEELTPERLAEMSPMSWVDGSEPPALILHGIEDNEIPYWMSEQFAAALEEARVEVELLLIEAEHAFELLPLDGPEMSQALAAIEAFLNR